jgi:putative transposase
LAKTLLGASDTGRIGFSSDIHYNPVKHGWVKQVKEWQYSTFHRWAERGVYPLDWAGIDEDLYGFE